MSDLSAFSLAGKRIAVTGANTGIGQGIAVAIALSDTAWRRVGGVCEWWCGTRWRVICWGGTGATHTRSYSASTGCVPI